MRPISEEGVTLMIPFFQYQINPQNCSLDLPDYKITDLDAWTNALDFKLRTTQWFTGSVVSAIPPVGSGWQMAVPWRCLAITQSQRQSRYYYTWWGPIRLNSHAVPPSVEVKCTCAWFLWTLISSFRNSIVTIDQKQLVHSRNTCKKFIATCLLKHNYVWWVDHNHNRNNCKVTDTLYKTSGVLILHSKSLNFEGNVLVNVQV